MEAGAPEATKKQLMACTGGRTSQTKSESLSYDHHGDNLRKQTRAAVKHAAQSEPQETGKQRRKGQSSRAKPSGSRPSSCWTSSASRSCTTLPAKSEWVACVFCIDFLFFRGTRGHKICQREDRHSLRPSHCKAASDPDARQAAPPAHCDRHETRAGIVALESGSALEIWAFLMKSLSLPMCTKQTTCRGAAPASRLDPLALRGDTRGRSKALIFAVLNGASFTDPELVMFSRNPENLRTKYLRNNRKSHHLRPNQIPRSRCNCTHCSSGFLHAGRTTFANLRTRRAWSRFFILRQSSGYVHTTLRCWLACISPPSSPNPRLASEFFALVKDESSDRFIGDIRPLNRRERSIGRAHLPYPDARSWESHRQCRLQFEPTDCFYLYDVPPSRVAIQVIGPRVAQNCLDHWDDENLDAVDTGYTLKCAHADNCLLLCTNDLCWLVGSPSRAQRRPGTHTWKTLSFPVLCVLLTRTPFEVRRADVACDFLQMPTHAHKPWRAFSEDLEEEGRRASLLSG